MLTYVRRSKASLVNMFVTFCGKLECSFLTATMLVLYLHFLKTAKVPRSKTNYESYNWQIFWPKDTKGNRKFMTFRFSSVLIRFLTFLFIFVSIGLQTTHLSYDKNDVKNILWCDITSIFFSVRTYTRLEILLPPPKPLALISYRK